MPAAAPAKRNAHKPIQHDDIHGLFDEDWCYSTLREVSSLSLSQTNKKFLKRHNASHP